MRRRELLAVTAIALVPRTAAADVVGSYEPWELYAALIADAGDRETAAHLHCCAGHDLRVGSRDLEFLSEVLAMNHSAPP